MRPKRYRLAALNVVAHPHTPETYARQFESAVKLRRAIKISGEIYAEIATAFRLKSKAPEAGITGEIFRYVEIDPTRDWYDSRVGEPATEEEVDKVVIPDYLKPHLQRLRYVFFPKDHRFIYVSEFGEGAMSPPRTRSFLEDLLNSNALSNEFPPVEVTIEQSPDELDLILNLPTLEYLEITVNRPNPDDGATWEHEVEQDLRNQKASKKTVILHSDRQEGLKPDKETRKLAKVATSNGLVVARGVDAFGKKRDYSTVDHPLEEVIDVREEQESFLERFLDKAREMVDNIRL